MKACNRNAVLVLLLVCVLFCACGAEGDADSMGSEVWETMPALTYGEMDSEKLQILEWNNGRCEATSKDATVETENGYYMFIGSTFLQYADKNNLSNWLPVCNKPNCLHQDQACNAYTASLAIVIKDNRIYYQIDADAVPELYSGGAGFLLVSMKPDGTDKRFEFAFDEYTPHTMAKSTAMLTSQNWIYSFAELNDDGTQTARSYRITEKGVEEYPAIENVEDFRIGFRPIKAWGDRVFGSPVLSESPNVFHRYCDGQLQAIDLTDMHTDFSYISGNTLRYFNINDGYYDINIETGETRKIADAQLQNSFANIVLPNCIIESTLMAYLVDYNADHYTEGTTHRMQLFDGESWREVVLPDELANANGMTFVLVQCVTSDSIILYSRDLSTYRTEPITNYYIIDLTTEDLAMELFLSHSASHG